VLVGVPFYTPMRGAILSGVTGLPANPREYATPGVQMMLFVAIVWGYSSLARGLLPAMRKTQIIAGSARIRLLVVIAVGRVTRVAPHLNGAAVGLTAIGVAFLAEALILGWRARYCNRMQAPIFPQEV
jgi:O-antigen/teichoic acid export membrane protein